MRWVTLTSWWAREARDNATTSDPAWSDGGMPTGYRKVRDEGLVLDEVPTPTPRGYEPLLRYYDPARRDHATTSHPSWRSPTEGGYRLERREGWALAAPYAGTTPLTSWWSRDRLDNVTTASGTWRRHAPDIPAEYSFVREEGHVRPPQGALPIEDVDRIGYASYPRRGIVWDVLVVLCDYTDETVSRSGGFWQSFVAGPDPSLAGYLSAVSGGRVQIGRTTTVRVDLGAAYATASANIGDHDRAVLQLAARETDLSAFDRNGDGAVAGGELVVLGVIAGNVAAASRRVVPDGRYGGIRFNGVTMIGMGDAGDLRLAAHEMFHTIEADQHNYGPGFALNHRASLFAGGGRLGDADAGPVDLDPWNKSLVGWVRPRLLAIGRAGGVAQLHAAQFSHQPVASGEGPLAFYDPRRGTDELLLVEYRCPTPRGAPQAGVYDSMVAGQGIAVWYVKRNPAGSARAGLAVDFQWPQVSAIGPDGERRTTIAFDRPPDMTTRSSNTMVANFLVGPTLYATAPLWTDRDGTMALRWGDGWDTGLRMRVGPLDPNQPMAIVTWWHADQPFLPRLDRCVPDRLRAARRASVVLDGMLAPGEDIEVLLRGDDEDGPGQVIGDNSAPVGGVGSRAVVSLSVPGRPGRHRLSVRRVDGSTSNELPVVVTY